MTRCPEHNYMGRVVGTPGPCPHCDALTPLLHRLDEALLDGPGGEAEAPLIYAAVEMERLSPNDPMPSCLRALAGVLAEERAR